MASCNLRNFGPCLIFCEIWRNSLRCNRPNIKNKWGTRATFDAHIIDLQYLYCLQFYWWTYNTCLFAELQVIRYPNSNFCHCLFQKALLCVFFTIRFCLGKCLFLTFFLSLIKTKSYLLILGNLFAENSNNHIEGSSYSFFYSLCKLAKFVTNA